MRKRWVVVGGLALAVLLALGWLASIASQGEDSSPKDKEVRSFDWKKALVRSGTEELRRNPGERAHRFAFMAREAEAMREKTRHAVAVSVGGVSELGLRLDRAHLLPTTTGGGVWVTEGDGVTCMSSAVSGATSCDTSLHAWRRGLPLEVCKPTTSPRRPPTDCLALGIVPNWAGAVRVRIGPDARVVPTLGATYSLRAAGPINVVSMVR